MLNYKPQLDTNGEVKPIFNPDDFEKQYASVTYADLLDYANLYSSNNFLGSNSFVDIFVSSINGIVSQTLGYIATLRGDAQEQIDTKRDKTDNTFTGPIYTVIDNANHKLSTETYVDTSVLNMKNSILNGAGPAYDTLVELQNELINNDTQINNLLSQISTKAPINNPTFTGTVNGITKAMIGLSNVDNTSDTNKPISTATQSALDLKAPINNPTFTGTVNGITKAMVGLSNVDNTSDANKPISSATQTVLNLKANLLDPVFSNNITVNNNATFNKGIQVTETAPNVGLSLRSTGRTSQLNFLSGVNAGNYNPITADSDNLIVYHNGSKDTGALNIINWSDTQNGIKLTRQLTKVHGNFEVSSGSIVGSAIFRPTGNTAYGLGNNIFNTTALTNPIIYNGITTGTGNSASFTDFNVSFNSWYGTGFVCTANQTCNAYLDHTNGNFVTKGNLTSNDINCRAITLSGNINMPNNSISARELYLSANLNMASSDIFARQLTMNGIINMQKNNINNVSTINSDYCFAYEQRAVSGNTALRMVGDSGINYIQSGTDMTGGSKAKLRFTPMYSSDATMTIDHTNKRVGICNDNPTNSLSVGGNVDISGTLQCSNNITQNNLLLQGDNVNAYIRPTNAGSTLYLGAKDENFVAINKSGIYCENNLITNSPVTMNKFVNMPNTAQFIPNTIIETSFPKTFQQNGVINVGYISVTEFDKTINFSIPISLYRQYRNVVANASFFNGIEDTLTSVTYTINKNGNFFATGACTYTDSLPKVVKMTSSSSLSSRNYEVYMTNVKFSFTPTFDSGNGIYTIFLTPVYSTFILLQQSNIIMESVGFFANTLQSGTTNALSQGSPGANFASTNYTLSSSSKFLTGSGILKTTDLITNNIENQSTIATNNLLTFDLTTYNLNVTNFSSYFPAFSPCTYTPAYYIDGNVSSTGYVMQSVHPILSSVRSLGGNDDAFIVAPGYILVIYRYANYVILSGARPWTSPTNTDVDGQTRVIDNRNGYNYVVMKSRDNLYNAENQVQSCRLYYKSYDREITLPIFS